jgi:hypothetical protein
MFRLDLAAITLADGVAVRLRPVGPGGDVATVVERWNGSAWVTGGDALGIPTSDWPSNPPPLSSGGI